MSSALQRRWVAGFALVGLFIFAAVASAQPLTDWSAPDVVFMSDPVGDAANSNATCDITGIWYRFTNQVHYFRVDMDKAPELWPGRCSPDYMIHLDTVPGGAGFGASSNGPTYSLYVAPGLTGIDKIVDRHFNVIASNDYSHLHKYDASETSYRFTLDALSFVGGVFQRTENGGKTFEWSVPQTTLLWTNAFTIHVAAQYISLQQVHDLAGPMQVGGVPLVRITDIQVGTDTLLRCSGVSNWFPVPWMTTNLMGSILWQTPSAFQRTVIPTDGLQSVWFETPTNDPAQKYFFKIVSTNAL